ncbi:hypothetical protein R0J87_24290, partial [Halomonas sp. SIMBA_159]
TVDLALNYSNATEWCATWFILVMCCGDVLLGLWLKKESIFSVLRHGFRALLNAILRTAASV